MSHRKKKDSALVQALLTVVIILMVLTSGLLIYLCLNMADGPSDPAAQAPSTAQTLPGTVPQTTEPLPTQTETVPPTVVSTVKLGAMGDVLLHTPFFEAQYHAIGNLGNGQYDFSDIFKYIKGHITDLDYAVANMETTLCGTDNGFPYAGYPHFNCPDQIVYDARDAGFDMFTTANNHAYDTTMVGLKRTVETIRGAGMASIGTMLTAEEPKFAIQEVGGIKIGMLSYTYADGVTGDGRPILNKNSSVAKAGLVNFFTYSNLTGFYSQVEEYLAQMKAAGAEATVLFIHWGKEYQIGEAGDTQKQMAQKLCDLGVDVIIGGHPHVIQPIDLLTSSADADHKTFVIYSLGNAISNQRRNLIKNTPEGHCEDGVLFTVSFEKLSDGTVRVSDVDALYTWVNKFRHDGEILEYNILPLDPETRDRWQTEYLLDDNMLTLAQESYEHTDAILGPGLELCRAYFAGR